MTDARVFRGFRFPAEVILGAVRWSLQFPLSYRDLERMLADRGVAVDHTCKGRTESPQKCRGETPQVAGPAVSRAQ